jgi:hypothetical protein
MTAIREVGLKEVGGRQLSLPTRKNDRVTHGLQRDSNHATKRRIHFHDQKNRLGSRQRADHEAKSLA